MFDSARKLGLQTAMSRIIGIGETIEDFESLKNFVQKHKISKIHCYGLIPHKGTMFENAQIPTAEYQAGWIAKIRTNFPKIQIQCGIWADRTERISMLLKAGANTISKFQAITKFGTKVAREIEQQAENAGREFKGTLTKMPQINPEDEVAQLPFDSNLKSKISQKLTEYIEIMQGQKSKCEQ